ncbi:MAG: hypothetical protein PVF80_12950, partial [Gammaproteobacteria bacterium]
SELQLEWQDASLEEIIDDCLACLAGESLLEKSDENFHRPRRSDHRFVQLMRLAHIVQPILERYYMTFIVLWQSTSAPLSVDELERRCYLLAQKVSMIYGIDSPDFFDRLLFRDFIDTMLANRYLVENDQGCFEFAEGFDYVSLDLRSLLSTEVRSSILSLIKATPRGS